jgi:tRNA (guanine26-N2/guanine27-N2)-dimethyltransferase
MALQRACRQLPASLSSFTATLVALTNSTLPKRTLSAAASFIDKPIIITSSNIHHQLGVGAKTSFPNKVITAAMSSTTKEATSTSTNLPEGYEKITEGTITMHYPKSENTVFYNPVQVQNRDLSVLMIGMYAERRAERMWMIRKRKEVRKRMLHEQQQQQEGTNANANANDAESKSERKERLAQFEKDLDAEVAKAKETVNFTQLAQESSNTNDGMAIFEALAASGLRSLRYWKEVPGLRTMVVNDLDPGAIDLAGENVVRNGLEEVLVKDDDDDDDDDDDNRNNQGDTSMEDGGINDPLKRYNLRPRGIKLQVGDATHEMYMSRIPPTLHPSQYNTTQAKYQKTQYDVIDLDPYGSAATFLDAALQSIVSGGLMCITCTDMAALGGSHPETCYGRYGAFPVQRSGYLQELALRILLYHVSIIAGRYGRTIRPVLSVGMAFYCRVFVEVWDDKAGVSAVRYQL